LDSGWASSTGLLTIAGLLEQSSGNNCLAWGLLFMASWVADGASGDGAGAGGC